MLCPTRNLLLETLGTPAAASEALRAAVAAADLTTFADLAQQHAVAPAVADALHFHAADLPDDWAAWAEEVVFETTARNGWLLHHLTRVAAALHAAGIRFFALKGCDLLLTTYPRIGARHLDDIDLLVHPDDVSAASDALLIGGYPLQEAGNEIPFVDGGSYAAYVASQAGEKIHPAVHESPDGLSIELHRMLPLSRDPAAHFERLWANRVTRHRDGVEIPLLPRPDLVEHLCVHAFVQHHGDWRVLARHTADMLRLRDAEAFATAPTHPDARTAYRLTAALLALHAADAPAAKASLQRILFPGPSLRRVWDQTIFQRLLARRVTHDLRHQPDMLLRKLLPSDDYLAYHYGEEAVAAGRKRLLAKRLLLLPFRPFTGAR